MASVVPFPRGIPPTGPKVVSLVRVSTEGQAAEGRAGLDRQREAVRCIVKAHDLDLIKSYELVDVSGISTASHPDIIEILG